MGLVWNRRETVIGTPWWLGCVYGRGADSIYGGSFTAQLERKFLPRLTKSLKTERIYLWEYLPFKSIWSSKLLIKQKNCSKPGCFAGAVGWPCCGDPGAHLEGSACGFPQPGPPRGQLWQGKGQELLCCGWSCIAGSQQPFYPNLGRLHSRCDEWQQDPLYGTVMQHPEPGTNSCEVF